MIKYELKPHDGARVKVRGPPMLLFLILNRAESNVMTIHPIDFLL